MTAPHHADTRDDSKHVVAVYPGTFDPITNGHLDILERALAMFDQIIVTIALNVRKQPLFDVEERIGFIRDAIPGHAARVEFASFDGLLVEFCKSRGARVIVRGLRTAIGNVMMQAVALGDVPSIAKARDELNAYAKSEDEKDQFEIVAVVRSDAEI